MLTRQWLEVWYVVHTYIPKPRSPHLRMRVRMRYMTFSDTDGGYAYDNALWSPWTVPSLSES